MKAFLALYAPTIANSDDIATLCPNCPIHALDPHPIGSTLNSGSKVAEEVGGAVNSDARSHRRKREKQRREKERRK